MCTQVAQVVRLVQAAMAYNGSHFYHCKMLTPVLASTAGFVAARRPYGVADRKSIAPARAAGRGQHRGAAAAERRAVLQRRAVPRHPCGAGGLRGRLLGSIRRVAAGAHRVRRLEVAVRCGGCGGPGGCTHNVSGAGLAVESELLCEIASVPCMVVHLLLACRVCSSVRSGASALPLLQF